MRKKLNINHKLTTHKHNINQRKQTTTHTAETKLPSFSRLLRHSARSPGNEVGLFYNGPEHHMHGSPVGHLFSSHLTYVSSTTVALRNLDCLKKDSL